LAANVVKESRGLKPAALSIQNQLIAFRVVLTTEITNLIVPETNRKARIYIQEVKKQNTEKVVDWKDTEMYAFIGLLILAGVQKSAGESLSELRSSVNGRPVFRVTMSLNHFKCLLRFWRFDNIQTRKHREKTDKIAAFRELWEMFVQNLQDL
jgi:hypothetical protein